MWRLFLWNKMKPPGRLGAGDRSKGRFWWSSRYRFSAPLGRQGCFSVWLATLNEICIGKPESQLPSLKGRGSLPQGGREGYSYQGIFLQEDGKFTPWRTGRAEALIKK